MHSYLVSVRNHVSMATYRRKIALRWKGKGDNLHLEKVKLWRSFLDVLYSSQTEYNVWHEDASVAVYTVVKRRNFRSSHTTLEYSFASQRKSPGSPSKWLAFDPPVAVRNLTVRKKHSCCCLYFFQSHFQATSKYKMLVQSYLQFDLLSLLLWSSVLFTSKTRWMLSCSWIFMHIVPFYSCLAHSWVSLGQ